MAKRLEATTADARQCVGTEDCSRDKRLGAARTFFGGGIVNCNFSHDRCAAKRNRNRWHLPSALLAMASACCLVPFSVGCRVGCQEQVMAHHPAYEQLEQGCFGYEPTVWRSMPGDCQQAVRMIPNEVVVVPEKKVEEEPADAESSTPPMEGEEGRSPEESSPEESLLQQVPESSPLDLPGIVQPRMFSEPPAAPESPVVPLTEPPAAVPPAAVPPAAVPPAAVPPAAVPPAAEPPTAGPPPAEVPLPVSEESEQEASPVADPPVSRAMTLPVITGPVQEPASVSARELFRTIDEALNETARPKLAARAAKKPVEGSLSRFISY